MPATGPSLLTLLPLYLVFFLVDAAAITQLVCDVRKDHRARQAESKEAHFDALLEEVMKDSHDW